MPGLVGEDVDGDRRLRTSSGHEPCRARQARPETSPWRNRRSAAGVARELASSAGFPRRRRRPSRPEPNLRQGRERAGAGDPDVAAGDDRGDAGEVGFVRLQRPVRAEVEPERRQRRQAGEDPRRRHAQGGRQPPHSLELAGPHLLEQRLPAGEEGLQLLRARRAPRSSRRRSSRRRASPRAVRPRARPARSPPRSRRAGRRPGCGFAAGLGLASLAAAAPAGGSSRSSRARTRSAQPPS